MDFRLHPVHESGQNLVLLRGDRPVFCLLGQDHLDLAHDFRFLLSQLCVFFIGLQQRERIARGFGQALDVDPPPGQSCGKPRVDSRSTDRKAQLVFRDNYHRGLPAYRVLIHIDSGYPGGAQGLGDEGPMVGIPFDDIDLLVVEIAHDGLDSHAAQADASANRIDALSQSSHGHFCPLAGFTRDRFDLHQPLIDLRDLHLEKPPEHVRVRAGDDDDRTARGFPDLKHIDAHAIADAEVLAWNLLVPWEYGFRPPQPNRYRLGRYRVDGAMNHVTLPLGEFLILRIALSFTQALKDHLLRRLGRHSAEVVRRGFHEHHISILGFHIELARLLQ